MRLKCLASLLDTHGAAWFAFNESRIVFLARYRQQPNRLVGLYKSVNEVLVVLREKRVNALADEPEAFRPLPPTSSVFSAVYLRL